MRNAARGDLHLADPDAAGRFARGLKRVALAFFAAAMALALYAAIERRGLHADGANYMMRLLELETFDLAEPARRTIMVILQAPALLAIRLGWVDAAGAGFVFCLTLELVPLGLLAACYAALPAEKKHFFYFPLLHYLAGTLSAIASPICEGIAAAAYFWLLFYLVLFRPLRWAGLAAVFAVAAPALYLHEAMGGLALPLAAAAGWRAWREAAPARRAAFMLLALWFAAIAVIQTANILVPHSLANRAGLGDGLVGGWFLRGANNEINVPAWLGLIGLLILNVNSLFRAEGTAEPPWTWRLTGAFAALAAIGVGAAALWEGTVAPGQQFAARVNPAMISLLLSAGVLGSAWRPARQRWWARRSTVAISAILAASCLAWHAIDVRNWSIYLGTVRKVLAEQHGLVLPRDIEAGLSARDRRIFQNMSWFWVFPELSLVMAPGGKVAAIIARSKVAQWRPWSPEHPEQIPHSRFFETSAYRAALAGGERAR